MPQWRVSHSIASSIRASLRKARGIIIASSGQTHYEPSGRCSIYCECIFRKSAIDPDSFSKSPLMISLIFSAICLIRFTQSANIKAVPVHLTSLYDKASSFLASHAEQLHGTHFSHRQMLRFLVWVNRHNAFLDIQINSNPHGIPFVQ